MTKLVNAAAWLFVFERDGKCDTFLSSDYCNATFSSPLFSLLCSHI